MSSYEDMQEAKLNAKYYGTSRIDAMQDSYNEPTGWADDMADIGQAMSDALVAVSEGLGMTVDECRHETAMAWQIGHCVQMIIDGRGVDGDALYVDGRGSGAGVKR